MTQPSNVIGPDDDEPPRNGFAAFCHKDFLLLFGGHGSNFAGSDGSFSFGNRERLLSAHPRGSSHVYCSINH